MTSSGALIRSARLSAGLTQRELAERAGKAVSVIGRWERGEVLPPLETVAALVEAAGLHLEVSVTDGGHDLGLITQTLALSPAERLERVTRMANLVLAGRERMRERLPA